MVIFAMFLCVMAYNQVMMRREIEELKSGRGANAAKGNPPSTDPPVAGAMVSVDGHPTKGDPKAKVTVVEFSDYQCPFSGRYARETLPQVIKQYVDTGKVRYVYRDYPLPFHAQAGKAAEAARCAGDQGKYWELHDKIFANQSNLTDFSGIAYDIGLDAKKLQACVASDKYTAAVQTDAADGRNVGINGTPGFLIGYTDPKEPKIKVEKFISGAESLPTFQKVIDSLLAARK